MKEKTVDEWLEDIDSALLYREMFGREASWKKLELDYLNDPSGDTAIGPNLVYSMGDSLISSLGVPDPEYIVTPERRSGIEKAPIVESLDNYFVRKLRLKKYIDLTLIHGYLYGSMIMKIGYDSEFGWAPYYDIGSSNNLLGMTFTQFDPKGRRIESPDIMPGMPWVRAVLPHDFAVPWGTMFLEDAPWAAHRIVRHIDNIKADPKYENTGRLQPSISMQEYMESYLTIGTQKQKARIRANVRGATPKAEYVELWEVRDRMTGQILVISRNYDKFIRKAPDAIQAACGMPFVAGTLNRHPRSFWSVPPAYYLGQIQKTQFDISLQAEKQRRIGVLKFLFRKGAMSKESLSRLLSSDVGAAEGVETQFPLSEILAPVQSGVSYDSISQSENNRRDAREAIGFSRNQLGEFDAGTRRTAREASFVAQGSERRTDRRGQTMIDMYTELINKVNNIVFALWKVPRDVLSDEGWNNVTGEMLKGDYQYSVSLTTKRAISKAERKVEAMMVLGQLAQIPGIDIQSLFKYISDASGDPAFERILSPIASGNPAPKQLPAAPPAATAALQPSKGV